MLSLSQKGLDDVMLNSLMTQLPEHCIALLEDIDAAFTTGFIRNASSDSSEWEGERGASATRVTLSGLLNALDGVAAKEGRLLFATTNRYSALDPALIRPGRMDIHVEFRLASRYQARELFRRFYLPDANKQTDRLGCQPGRAGTSHSDADEGSILDSGYATPLDDIADGLSCLALDSAFRGMRHSVRAPPLTRAQIEHLAAKFSDAVPERELSMASLQGYLMMYKVRPVQAMENIPRWVEEKTGRDSSAAAHCIRVGGRRRPSLLSPDENCEAGDKDGAANERGDITGISIEVL